MGRFLPIAIALLGLAGGLGSGYALKPPAPPGACEGAGGGEAGDGGGEAGDGGEHAAGAPAEGSHGAAPAATTADAQAAGCAAAAAHREPAPAEDHGGHGEGAFAAREFAKLANPVVVPVLEDGRMKSLVVLSISLEVQPGFKEQVYSMEPKLRDAFLKVMFRHSNSGGFQGNFTERRAMRDLRGSLREAAAALLGDKLVDVLILDIVRQDVG
ncbi:MAG: flagellar basal body-associated FliL family protein [Paracoccaceae bacterium]